MLAARLAVAVLPTASFPVTTIVTGPSVEVGIAPPLATAGRR